MIQTILLHIFGSFVGTVAFAVLFNVPKRFYLCCGLTGTAGWMIYLTLTAGYDLSPALASFFGTLAVVLISRILTVRMKCPITIFLIIVLGIVLIVSIPREFFQIRYWRQRKALKRRGKA